MTTYTFAVTTNYPKQPKTTVTMTVENAESLNVVLKAFEDFLRGAGYSWLEAGTIQYVGDETESNGAS